MPTVAAQTSLGAIERAAYTLPPRSRIRTPQQAKSGETDGRSRYMTPRYIVRRVQELWADVGGIHLDPATEPTNPTGAARFFAPPQDGKREEWGAPATVWLNPPYGKTMPDWLFLCRRAAASGSRVLALVPGRYDSKWMQDAMNDARMVLFFNKRLRFDDGRGRAPFPNVLIAWNQDISALAEWGAVMRRVGP